MDEKNYEYAIKYKVVKIGDCEYLLFPIDLLNGYTVGNTFNSKYKEIVFNSISDVEKNKYVVYNVLSLDDLKLIYDFEDEDDSFLKDYFFEDYKNVLYYVNFKLSKLRKMEINLDSFRSIDYIDTYMYDDDLPSVVLNVNSVDSLLECENIEILKSKLKNYRQKLNNLDVEKKEHGVTRIQVIDDKICFVDSSMIQPSTEEDEDFEERDFNSKSDVSYTGLKNYIKERVLGHDDEIDIIAKILYMNYTALEDEKTDSILLTGPTGTGKTETFNAAMEYLNLPFISVNAANLVPQGIKGNSLEDCLYSLYLRSGKDKKLAQKGIVFLDEYDKFINVETEFKRDIRNILLTFNAGGDFNLEGEHNSIVLNSLGMSKVYAGVFDDLFNSKNVMGFGKKTEQDSKKDVRKALLEKNYFTLEELSRIKYIINYSGLDNELKRKILLESKLSEYLLKKKRYERQFGVELILDDSYIDALIEKISSSSMREINNIFSSTLDMAEIDMIENGNTNGKKLILTKDTVLSPNNYKLY